MNTTERIQQAIAHVKEQHPKSAGLYERALLGKCSRSQALKAKCLDCSNFNRDEVDNCTVTTCPLWHFRPRFGENKVLQKRTRLHVMTEEHKEKLRASLVKRRSATPCQNTKQIVIKNKTSPSGKDKVAPSLDW